MDDILGADDNDFNDGTLPWDDFDAALATEGATLEANRPLQEMLDDSPFRVLQGLDLPSLHDNNSAPLLDMSADSIGTPSTTLNLEASSTAVRELLHHYRTHVCTLMMPTTAPSRNPWLHLYLPLALRGPASSPNEALLYGILSVSAYNRANLTPSQRESFQSQGRDYSEKAAATLRCVLQSGAWTFDLEKNKDSSHALMAAALTLTTIEVSLPDVLYCEK